MIEADMTADQIATELVKQRDRYMAHMHGMQCGVAVDLAKGDEHAKNMEPKHLRVGVNSAMVDTGTLSRLLIAKGIFTELEFWTMLADVAEEEHRKYEKIHGMKLI